MNKSNLTIVLRTYHERTIDICYDILLKQISAENIYVIKEKPFFNAVKKTFKIGANNKSKYLLGLDADVLLFPDALNYMIYMAEKEMNKDVFRQDYFVYDKFRGRQTAGVHFYNNSYSKDFCDFLDTIDHEKEFIRAEFENVRQFCEQRNLSYVNQPHYIVGKHDYFQRYEDIINKYVLRAKKSIQSGVYDKVLKLIEDNLRNCPEDKDFLVACKSMKLFEKENLFISQVLLEINENEKKEISLPEKQMIMNSLKNNKIMNKFQNNI